MGSQTHLDKLMKWRTGRIEGKEPLKPPGKKRCSAGKRLRMSEMLRHVQERGYCLSFWQRCWRRYGRVKKMKLEETWSIIGEDVMVQGQDAKPSPSLLKHRRPRRLTVSRLVPRSLPPRAGVRVSRPAPGSLRDPRLRPEANA